MKMLVDNKCSTKTETLQGSNMLITIINNSHGTFVVLKDKIFHIESSHIFDVGPISEEDKKEIELTSRYVAFKKNGSWHRDNDLPAVVYDDGEKNWYENGDFIRYEYVNQQ